MEPTYGHVQFGHGLLLKAKEKKKENDFWAAVS